MLKVSLLLILTTSLSCSSEKKLFPKKYISFMIGVSITSTKRVLSFILIDISSKKSDWYKILVIRLISSSVIFLLKYLSVMFVI